jgi:hypothetical protein
MSRALGGNRFNMREFWKNIREQMKPKYHELTAYLTALACAVLFWVHPEFRATYFEILSGAGEGRASLYAAGTDCDNKILLSYNRCPNLRNFSISD